MQESYIAHYNPVTEQIQTVHAHNQSVSQLSGTFGEAVRLKQLAALAGLFHDAGKYSDSFQEYIRRAITDQSSVHRGEVNHATAGGLLIEKLIPRTGLAELIMTAIYSHHGLYDCINMEDGQPLLEKRREPEYLHRNAIEPEKVAARFYEDNEQEEVLRLCREASQQFIEIRERIVHFIKEYSSNKRWGNKDFYMGMYERLLLSILIDSDRLDTAVSMGTRERMQAHEPAEQSKLWQECISLYESYIHQLGRRSPVDAYRQEISDACRKAADGSGSLYRLTVPTGSGKTLSVLRFALYHAEAAGKTRIIYIAPYNSVLEQNAEQIRKALGREDIVLEHHSNVLHETEAERARYEQLTENWDSQVIVTTAVQFLNTLFSGKTGSIRRMHNLEDSVIIFDEIQSLPVRTTGLFNLAVNYLISFLNVTFVLCSATQPILDKLPQNRMLPPGEMISDPGRYEKAFCRTCLVDRTGLARAGMSVEELGSFILDRFKQEKQILVIVNTKACARRLFQYLKKQEDRPERLYHLSTNMCVKNRRQVLEQVRALLAGRDNKPVICVSTALIEAGVDISFQCVIRSLAGLDSIIQAAGRCNRNGELACGNVYLVRMSEEAEKLSRLPDIKIAQNAMKEVLSSRQDKPGYDGNSLFTEEAKEQFYLHYYQERLDCLDYPVTVHGMPTNLVDLLSSNEIAKRQSMLRTGKEEKRLLKQAFRTAGELFQVIPEDGSFDVVVEYDGATSALLEELEKGACSYARQKAILAELQAVTVGISEQTRSLLGRAVYPVCAGLIYVLNSGYYSRETGVLEEPEHMAFLSV